MHRPSSFQSILITGASSGLGAALAEEFAAPGVTLVLTGRRQAALDSVRIRCIDLGASAYSVCVDVRDATAMRDLVEQTLGRAPIDLIIANAGISSGTGQHGEGEDQARAIFETNVNGVLNTVLPAIPLMKYRGQGHIAIMSSLAGYRGLAGAPSYAASKAAVKSWGEGLRDALAADGIGVSVICPGFVETGITAANDFPMPFLMSAPKAAQKIRGWA